MSRHRSSPLAIAAITSLVGAVLWTTAAAAQPRQQAPRQGRHDGSSTTATPQTGGQLLHLFESPNRYGLPDFYTLHVWAWKENAAGTFSNWHTDVSCDEYR